MKKLFMDEDKNIEYEGKILATYKQVIDYTCGDGELSEGFYIISNGVIEVCEKDEDYEIVFIKNIKDVNLLNTAS